MIQAKVSGFEPTDSYFYGKGGVHKYNNMYLNLETGSETFRINIKNDLEKIWKKESFSNAEITFMKNTLPKSVELWVDGNDKHLSYSDLISWHKRFKSHRKYIYDKKFTKK